MLRLRRVSRTSPSSRRVLASEGRRCFATNTNVPLIIDGRDIETQTRFDVTSPLTGTKIWSYTCATKQHVRDAIRSAQDAFPSWSQTKASHRRDIFLNAANIMDSRRNELGDYMHHEIGAGQDYQDFILGLAIEGFKDTAGRISGAVSGVLPESNLQGMKAMVCKRPNAPYHLGLRSVLFALATGNTAILKGAELSPRCYWAIADVFREAGLPEGCLNLIFHAPSDAPAIIDELVNHPDVKKVNFTGSSQVGSIIAEMAGRHLKPVLMELGGKASAIVLPDADLDNAALHCAKGAFMNAGQICMSTERIIVHESIADNFHKALVVATRDHFGSKDSTPVLVTVASARRNRDLVADAMSKGATSMTPKEQLGGLPETRMAPMLLKDVNKKMTLYQTESFGPSVSLFTFKSEDEAVSLANDTKYGLSASVFTRDLGAAFRIGESLESGAVHINSMTVHDEYSLPHGGVKQSGFGRFNGCQGLDEFMYYKTITWME
ncbi:unnamed protein product [Colletotrichum noveboracense]|uniref:Aldehyde dehydrogenase domain-containing protein n=1 Tax=Colletotrichum noveboracense TaxID=2664923 RepID=A0A9W4RNS9_9PEZI|nr:unnamed protein product [Colletotrichum noveboracense]